VTDAAEPATVDVVPAREVEPLTAPREGVPPVIETPAALIEAADALAAGTGPVAVDAERATGYRYGQRAYLVQLRREGSGSHLVDPMAVRDLAPLARALEGTEWVLHAASQDLPCLREIGLEPASLFDTELAGRLLGHPRVGLAALLEVLASLAKEHPLPTGRPAAPSSLWLRYAALDVELLSSLRDALEVQPTTPVLAWAHEEFRGRLPRAAARAEGRPWRRTPGVHRPASCATAVVRSLWERRDDIARRRDTSPGRVLPDCTAGRGPRDRPRPAHRARDPARLQRARRPPPPQRLAGRGRRRPRAPRLRAPRHLPARRRPAAAAVLARPRPGGRCPPRGGAHRRRPGRGRARDAGREPALPRPAAPRLLDAADPLDRVLDDETARGRPAPQVGQVADPCSARSTRSVALTRRSRSSGRGGIAAPALSSARLVLCHPPTTTVREVRRALATVADPARAAGMQAYMKSSMPFLGVSRAHRRPAAGPARTRPPTAT
jgi:ribonuclease D